MTLSFHTIAYSHYVDAGRWALTAKGYDFVEYGYIPGFHYYLSGIDKLRAGRKGLANDHENSGFNYRTAYR